MGNYWIISINRVLLFFIFSTTFHLSEARDICNPNAVLLELEQFKLSQPIKRSLPLDFSPYTETIKSLIEYSPLFEAIVQNYTKNDTFKELEPETVVPYDSDYNAFKIEAAANILAYECSSKRAEMMTYESLSSKNLILKAMKALNLSKIPLKLFHWNGVLSTFSGKHVLKLPPGQGDTHLDSTWVNLKENGNIEYPSSADKTSSKTAICLRKNNFWDLKESNKNIFMGLMGKMLRQLSLFNKNTLTFSKQLELRHKPTTNSLKLFPPVPLSQLSSLIKKFSSLDTWEETTPTDFSTIMDIFKLIKSSKTFFNQFKQNKFPVDPLSLLNRLNMEPSRFEGGSSLSISSDITEANPTIITTITDNKDLYTLYEIKAHVHTGYIPIPKYTIKGPTKSTFFTTIPTLVNCENPDNDISTCDKWIGDTSIYNCEDFVSGMATANSNSCPLIGTNIETSAVRTNCQTENGLVISTSKDELALKIYCDNEYNSQLLISSPLKSLPTTCEVRELVDNIEYTLAPQLNEDLIDTTFDLGNNLFKTEMETSNVRWFKLIQNSLPLGFGVVAFMGIMVCATTFCIRPSRFMEMYQCLFRCNKTPDEHYRPDVELKSRPSTPGSPRSPINTPIISRQTSRAGSPARSAAGGLVLSHTYRD